MLDTIRRVLGYQLTVVSWPVLLFSNSVDAA
jgi:hypothetical protein